ncbi:hypothetical protein VOI54_09780 [Tamlana sp. 2201CG12-4]|uniref:hypothetical protein n=1 Tax=Tamlana sp. 2201CG12-4 TaxID=3112582 RepID=UPI002DBFEE6D|nr:hypothetical protein [Tamlana sp. 2201CG12-4]MEC3907306.1 hypothetical protein [Tamlana sp. 2201CG12-4]
MEVITLNVKGFQEKCGELRSKLDFLPDLTVGVLHGGGFVVDEFNNVKSEYVKFQRENWLKNTFFIKFLLKKLPYSILNRLRVIESRRVEESINHINKEILKDQVVDFQFDYTKYEEINTVLIVDDAIDSGKTMFVVKNSLSNLFPNAQIKTAVISWTIEDSIINPDYFIYKKTLVRFPWSKDYKGKDFEK